MATLLNKLHHALANGLQEQVGPDIRYSKSSALVYLRNSTSGIGLTGGNHGFHIHSCSERLEMVE